METLQTVLERDNLFVEVYQQANQLARTTALTEYRIQLNFCKGSDRRHYNLPTSDNELAIIIPGDEDAFANSRDILLRPRGGPLIRITECHPSFIPLHFPLLCPTGQLSWNLKIPYATDNSKCVSLSQFSKFRLHTRPTAIESSHFFKSAHLFQELLVHWWAAAEHSRLMWIRQHQKELRAELYCYVPASRDLDKRDRKG
jgi:hypothetical protein